MSVLKVSITHLFYIWQISSYLYFRIPFLVGTKQTHLCPKFAQVDGLWAFSYILHLHPKCAQNMPKSSGIASYRAARLAAKNVWMSDKSWEPGIPKFKCLWKLDKLDMLNNFCFHVYAQKWVFVIMSHVTLRMLHVTLRMPHVMC